MKVTKIAQQAKRAERYSIFVDGEYSFSLGEGALLDSKIFKGQELTSEQLEIYKKLANEDKVYGRALRYAVMRQRSTWEMQTYLERKLLSPALIWQILNKLTNVGLLNDASFAEAYVRDKRLLRPTSRRKLIAELRHKHLSDDIIQMAVGNEPADERQSIKAVITKARRQTKYRDDETKLMQYLARQGFSYEDIKQALKSEY